MRGLLKTLLKIPMRVGTGLHAKIVRFTGLGGKDRDGSVLVLRHTGAKSGRVRETPLMFLNHRGGFAVVASMGGAPDNPGWYHNLVANPEAHATIDRTTRPVRAREIEGDERSEVWDRLTKLDRRWEQYQSRTDRVLPILVLDPV